MLSAISLPLKVTEGTKVTTSAVIANIINEYTLLTRIFFIFSAIIVGAPHILQNFELKLIIFPQLVQ